MDADRITINYTYYNNLALARLVFNHYETSDYDKSKYTFNIVDDGSKEQPLMLSLVPDRWNVLRVDTDKLWNSEGARNLAVHNTTTDWMINIDLDAVVNENTLRLLPDTIYELNPFAVTRFCQYTDWTGDVRRETHNDYITTKELYDHVGGYAESHELRRYGGDGTFLNKVDIESRDDVAVTRIVPFAWKGDKHHWLDDNPIKDEGRLLFPWTFVRRAKE